MLEERCVGEGAIDEAGRMGGWEVGRKLSVVSSAEPLPDSMTALTSTTKRRGPEKPCKLPFVVLAVLMSIMHVGTCRDGDQASFSMARATRGTDDASDSGWGSAVEALEDDLASLEEDDTQHQITYHEAKVRVQDVGCRVLWMEKRPVLHVFTACKPIVTNIAYHCALGVILGPTYQDDANAESTESVSDSPHEVYLLHLLGDSSADTSNIPAVLACDNIPLPNGDEGLDAQVRMSLQTFYDSHTAVSTNVPYSIHCEYGEAQVTEMYEMKMLIETHYMNFPNYEVFNTNCQKFASDMFNKLTLSNHCFEYQHSILSVLKMLTT